MSDVIAKNSQLITDRNKAGRLAVNLARESFFGNEEMRAHTLSALDNEKKKKIKEKIHDIYQFTNALKFEPVRTKCLTAISKACQALRRATKEQN